ncbi:MAG TPA: DUF2897 family protein [Marinobacter sp.]|nr:DUF2897 family protein [Marinobacter sp.]
MPVIGWVFLIASIALVLGSLMFLRDSGYASKISDEKMKKILARKAEMEAKDKAEDKD